MDNSSTTTGELQKVEVAQEKVGDEYKYSVSVNDKELINVVNNQTYAYKDVYIFAGAPWFKPDGGVIKKLTYFTKGTRFFEKCPYKSILANKWCVRTRPRYHTMHDHY